VNAPPRRVDDDPRRSTRGGERLLSPNSDACGPQSGLTGNVDLVGRNAQEAVFAGSLDEPLISDPLLPFPLAPVRQEGARCGHS
jgi:hypothetical protein